MMKKWLLLKNIKARVQKPYPIYDQNGRNQLKSIPYLWPKRLKNPTLWGRTYLYSPYKGVPPPPGVLFYFSHTASLGKCRFIDSPGFVPFRGPFGAIPSIPRIAWSWPKGSWPHRSLAPLWAPGTVEHDRAEKRLRMRHWRPSRPIPFEIAQSARHLARKYRLEQHIPNERPSSLLTSQ